MQEKGDHRHIELYVHRYGSIRLPLLLDGWEVVDRVGWDDARLAAEASYLRTYEPVFVLRKPPDSLSKNCKDRDTNTYGEL
jgi:hypothetical protein